MTAAVNKCGQTALLFFLSDFLFCGVSSTQCLSTMKMIGAGGVCLGVALYGYFGATASKPLAALEQGPNACALNATDGGTSLEPCPRSSSSLDESQM